MSVGRELTVSSKGHENISETGLPLQQFRVLEAGAALPCRVADVPCTQVIFLQLHVKPIGDALMYLKIIVFVVTYLKTSFVIKLLKSPLCPKH